jgi:hypothetical protein
LKKSVVHDHNIETGAVLELVMPVLADPGLIDEEDFLAVDDTQPRNPNKTPKMFQFSITQVRGRLQGG